MQSLPERQSGDFSLSDISGLDVDSIDWENFQPLDEAAQEEVDALIALSDTSDMTPLTDMKAELDTLAEYIPDDTGDDMNAEDMLKAADSRGMDVQGEVRTRALAATGKEKKVLDHVLSVLEGDEISPKGIDVFDLDDRVVSWLNDEDSGFIDEYAAAIDVREGTDAQDQTEAATKGLKRVILASGGAKPIYEKMLHVLQGNDVPDGFDVDTLTGRVLAWLDNEDDALIDDFRAATVQTVVDVDDSDAVVTLSDTDEVVTLSDTDEVVALDDTDEVVALDDTDEVVALDDTDAVVTLSDTDDVVALDDTDEVVALDTPPSQSKFPSIHPQRLEDAKGALGWKIAQIQPQMRPPHLQHMLVTLDNPSNAPAGFDEYVQEDICRWLEGDNPRFDSKYQEALNAAKISRRSVTSTARGAISEVTTQTRTTRKKRKLLNFSWRLRRPRLRSKRKPSPGVRRTSKFSTWMHKLSNSSIARSFRSRRASTKFGAAPPPSSMDD